ncbi:MAG: molybdate ABC transporter permease subunit [Bacteroidota bacterium]
MDSFIQTLVLTFKLAVTTTTILFVLGIPLANWLAYSKFKAKFLIETIVSMPIVLPPSVLGFYLLTAFSPQNSFGKLLESWFSLRLVFSFEGLVVASIIYSLPFMVRPIQAGLEHIPASIREASYTMGKSRLITLWRVLLPNIKPALITGVILTFAHTVGEFGIVLMIGGNIPGETRVASIAIYDEMEALHYGAANMYSLTLFLITFLILLAVFFVNKKYFQTPS